MPELRVGPIVRAVSPTSIVIWAELTAAETVTLLVQANGTRDEPQTVSQKSTLVGGHHYVALELQHLQPATWYNYQLFGTIPGKELVQTPALPMPQCFRTLATQPQATEELVHFPLRIAYGSCRKAEVNQSDVLSVFGHWLHEHFEQRESAWPHLLLLIGDQIYADEPSASLQQASPHLGPEASSYEDFCLFYQHAWSTDSGVRQVLASLPSYMIFDDHEITNNWNSMPTWRAKVTQSGREQVLIDGVVAYWIYQGWGNLAQHTAQHPLLAIMRQAAESGEDALERLRDCIREDLYGRVLLHWHYEIPSTPPIFVANARTERTAIFTDSDEDIFAPTRIISHSQANDLQNWFSKNPSTLAILVSSVPVLLPPAIGWLEYLMGQRPWMAKKNWLHGAGLQLARLQQRIAMRIGFDHWPLYPVSWQDLLQIFQQPKDTLILSGDVHFSYALAAQLTSRVATDTYLYQFVSTPLQNELSASDQSKIKLQAHLSQWRYGGLKQRILPLAASDKTAHIDHNLLFENTLAMVTLQADTQGRYTPQQDYLGSINGHLQKLATTILPPAQP
ncbi:alkaline phosphatase D family protein [Dictyobacter kobayashii]|uniref:Alkaline phosphatase n=1 Tax=Dictyobacter kobayashii TaxID=2014872 RepID=A0A402ADR1_9CHLR|nr:alkaline phosphatase D family protein [Dictyobacter kobayashii]GCE17233.1 alkaline phosphatase [Dictyobacter kobayashii]